MRGLRLAVIGTGALGSTLLHRLGQSGVRDVLLVDPDGVQERNLRLSPFLRAAATAGSSPWANLRKAALLAGEAQRCWQLPWRAVCAEVADTGWQLLADRDLLLCCTDSALSRAETAWIGHCLGKPLIEGGVFGAGIPAWRTSWFPPAEAAACYLCGMGGERRAQVLAYAVSASLGCAPMEDPPPMTGTPETLGCAAEAMVQLLLSFANRTLPQQRSSARRSSLAGGVWTDEQLTLTRSQHCPWHAPLAGTWMPLPWEVPIRDILHAAGRSDLVLQLPWQLCTLARCRGCGKRTEPFARVARVRRVLACPCCGQSALESIAGVSAVRKQDTLAERSLRQLGQPDQHLYLLREPIVLSRSAATMMKVPQQ